MTSERQLDPNPEMPPTGNISGFVSTARATPRRSVGGESHVACPSKEPRRVGERR